MLTNFTNTNQMKRGTFKLSQMFLVFQTLAFKNVPSENCGKQSLKKTWGSKVRLTH